MQTAMAQKGFVGRLEYHIKPDTISSIADKFVDTMIVYTNDTIVRVESRTRLGEQVLIKHLQLKKSYLLLNVNGEKFAIQTQEDTSITKKSVVQNIRYTWLGSKKFSGMKGKKAKIEREDLPEIKTIYYNPKIRTDLLDVYAGIKGLPLEYYLQHTDGIYKYSLNNSSEILPERDLFGIPSDYKKTTFEEFMKVLLKN